MQLNPRTILISGASSGIGRACAIALLEQGHSVIGISRDCTQFTTAHPRFSSIEIDLSDLDKLPNQLKQLSKQQPTIDSIIFSAGKGQFSSLEEFSFTQIQALINLNFVSPSFLAKGFLPALKRKPLADLVFIGSEAALAGNRKGSIYCASKFAVRGFTEALMAELNNSPIQVHLVHPGGIATNIARQDHTQYFAPLGKLLTTK